LQAAALLFFFRVRIELRLRKQEHVVTAEVPVRFLAGYQEKVAVGESLTTLEIDFLLIEPNLAGIVRMCVPVEVGEYREVDAKIAKHGTMSVPRRGFPHR